MLAILSPSIWPTFTLLVKAIQSHAKAKDYAVVKQRTTKNKMGNLIKAYFCCDREEKYKDKVSEKKRMRWINTCFSLFAV